MDGFTWAQLGTLASVLLGVLGLAFGIWKQRSADLRTLHGRIDDVKDKLTGDLHTFKVEVARDYPTSKELVVSESRLTEAMRELTLRIDRWFERHP